MNLAVYQSVEKICSPKVLRKIFFIKISELS